MTIEVGLSFRLQNRFKCGEFADFLRAEIGWLVEHKTVAVTQDIGGEPAIETEAASADDGGKA